MQKNKNPGAAGTARGAQGKAVLTDRNKSRVEQLAQAAPLLVAACPGMAAEPHTFALRKVVPNGGLWSITFGDEAAMEIATDVLMSPTRFKREVERVLGRCVPRMTRDYWLTELDAALRPVRKAREARQRRGRA